MKAVLVGLVLTVLAGCSAQNSTINRLQFSGATVAFPESYQAEAARVVLSRGGRIEAVRVSRPQETLGASVFGPKRWYSCLSGLPAPTRAADRIPKLEDAISGGISAPVGRFDTILFFSTRGHKPSVRSGFDSPLCADAEFESIILASPA